MSLKDVIKLGLSPITDLANNNYRGQTKQLTYDDLLNSESEIGRTLFGPIPYGHQREFFESKKNVWIWHENWLDEAGIEQSITIRYEVRPTGVYKKLSGGKYTLIENEELENFMTAVRTYFELAKQKLYC
jgi:hypothetical protein